MRSASRASGRPRASTRGSHSPATPSNTGSRSSGLREAAHGRDLRGGAAPASPSQPRPARLSRLQRAQIKRFVARKLQEDGLSAAYVKLIVAVLSALFAAARDDGVPVRLDAAAGLGRVFKLAKSTGPGRRTSRRSTGTTRPLPRHAERRPRACPAVPAHGADRPPPWRGARPPVGGRGPASRTLHVRRNLSAGEIGTPKSGTGRAVDLSHTSPIGWRGSGSRVPRRRSARGANCQRGSSAHGPASRFTRG